MQPNLAVFRLLTCVTIRIVVPQQVIKDKKTDNSSDAGSKTKRRWINIGPGIVIALAVSALIGSQYIESETAARQRNSAPPIVEQQIITSSYEEKSGPTPELSYIIDQAEELRITSSQLAQLKKLQAEWQQFYGPKIAQAHKAASEADKYLSDVRDQSRTPVSQISSAAEPVITLSGEISSARRSYWDRAVKILTQEQQKLLQTRREADWAAKKDALNKARKRIGG